MNKQVNKAQENDEAAAAYGPSFSDGDLSFSIGKSGKRKKNFLTVLNHTSLTHESFLAAATPQDHPMDSIFPRIEANIPSSGAELLEQQYPLPPKEALRGPLGSHSLETFPTGHFVLQRKFEKTKAWVPGRHLGTK